QWLPRVDQPAELIAAGPVEVAPQLLVGVAILEMACELGCNREPSVAEARLVRPDGREQSPRLVAQLAANPIGVGESARARVAIGEQALERQRGISAQFGERVAPRGVD